MSRSNRHPQSSVFCYQIRESRKHYLGKQRLYDFFKGQGYEAYKEVPSREILDNGEIKNFVIDVLIGGKFIHSDKHILIILEVDGKKGHRTGITDNKAKTRDSHFLEKYKIPTVRFSFEDLHGVNKIDDDLIIQEVEYWIKVNYDKVITQNKLIYSKKSKCCRCGHFSNVHTFSGCMICECQWGFIHELQ